MSDPSSVDKNSTESCGTNAVFYNQHEQHQHPNIAHRINTTKNGFLDRHDFTVHSCIFHCNSVLISVTYVHVKTADTLLQLKSLRRIKQISAIIQDKPSRFQNLLHHFLL